MKRVLGLLLALGLSLGLAPTPRAAPAADSYDVQIRRDRFGVPHVLGKTDADAAYGLGFAQSEDDYATLQESIFAARGRLSALKGADGVLSDTLAQLLDVQGVVARRYETDLPLGVRRILDGYAAGVNRYAALHPDKVAQGFLPVTGRDLAAFTLFRGPTFYGLDGVFGQVATGRLTLPKDEALKETGSNGLALAPSRSADGHTRLLFNSHQPFTGPLTWYEAVVESGEGWHVAGGFFPASPFMLGGHNAHLGWAATVNHPDLVDVYRLTVNPANADQYRLDGQWRDLEKRTVEIPVKQADGSLKSVTREILRSVHGPVLRSPQGTFAIRYPTTGGLRQLAQMQAMNKAKTFAQWKAAMAMQALPSVNYIYADEKGNVGYLSNGIYPKRKDGPDWSGVVPGDRSDLIWTEARPFAQSPQVWNPKSGFVFNSNNTPFKASAPADDLKPSDFPTSMGIETEMTNRAWRALETYGADPSITAQEFNDYKYDLAYSPRSDEFAWVKAVLAADPGGDADLAAAQGALRQWDGQTDLKNRGAALVALMWLQKRMNPTWTPLQMVQGSIPILKKAYGRVDPQWGEVNRLRRGTVDLPVDGGPDVYRAIYGKLDPDGRLHAVNGDCYLMFIEWDRNGKLTSRSIHQFGSATLDETSPHYADQAPLFAAHQTKPVLFTEAELAGNISRSYRPGN
jgi:penicillin amidase/acyl-homoserine-lactone acylase